MLQSNSILNKVPQVTIFFWISKIFCALIGQGLSLYLDKILNSESTATFFVLGLLCVLILFFQFRAKKYVPSLYWLTVVFISALGALIPPGLADKLGVSLVMMIYILVIFFALTLAMWYKLEKTLSIYSIVTFRREAFYWVTMLLSLALGSAIYDVTRDCLGYLIMLFIYASLVGITTATFYALKIKLGKKYSHHSMVTFFAFWLICIFTWPFGLSIVEGFFNVYIYVILSVFSLQHPGQLL